MKKSFSLVKAIACVFALLITTSMFAQEIQNWRPWDQTGINVFEPAKDMDTPFNGLKVRVGGAFTQQFQSLSHSNAVGEGVEGGLYDLSPGFNNATANLNFDVQLDDGIRVALENYMSSRHHTEFWVKGGYIQIDKLPMFDNSDWFDKNFRVKIGHFQPNYGDQQFRRSDNGNAIYNPFVGNYIMDAFSTEIGAEVYVFPVDGFLIMAGATAGLIKGDIATPAEGRAKKPSIYLKAAYDKAMENDLRVRLSASLLANGSTIRNTIYGGDRTGSRFYGVMEEAGASLGSAAFSGRFNPNFRNNIMAIQINPFVKFKGLEIFAIYEMASGNTYTVNDKGESELLDDTKRSVSQIGAEVIYRFLADEQLYIGGKYNMISGELSSSWGEPGNYMDASINRIEVAAGWFPTKNLLLKVGYVQQKYVDIPADNLTTDGEFGGVVIEAVVGF